MFNQGHDMAVSRIPGRAVPPCSMVLTPHPSGSAFRSIPLPHYGSKKETTIQKITYMAELEIKFDCLCLA